MVNGTTPSGHRFELVQLISGQILTGDEAGEAVQTIDHGGKLAEGLEVTDDHCQRRQDRRKSAGGLDCPANLEFPRNHPAGNDRAGQDDGDEAIAILKQVQIQLRPD